MIKYFDNYRDIERFQSMEQLRFYPLKDILLSLDQLGDSVIRLVHNCLIINLFRQFISFNKNINKRYCFSHFINF